MKLDEETPPLEIAQDPLQPPSALAREMNADTTARDKIICLILNSIIAYSSNLAFNLMVQLEVALAAQSEVCRAQAGRRQQQGHGVRPRYVLL
jgi:hypothetical protein